MPYDDGPTIAVACNIREGLMARLSAYGRAVDDPFWIPPGAHFLGIDVGIDPVAVVGPRQDHPAAFVRDHPEVVLRCRVRAHGNAFFSP